MTDTREELLQAGILLYTRLRSSHLQSLTAERVATTAGFHRQTFYRYWETQAEYVQDLVRFALGAERDLVAGTGFLEAVDGESVPTEFESFLRALARHEFARYTGDPIREFRFGLIATRGGPDGVDDLIDEFVGRLRSAGTDAVAALLGVWGREPTDSYTALEIALTVESVAMGLTLAAPFIGQSEAAGLYEQLVVDLLLVMTRPRPT